MPFTSAWIEENLAKAAEGGRLAHTFLLVGDSLEELEELFFKISRELLETEKEEHPDLHVVRPESKTRRILIEQIRDLEKALQLKPYQAKRKVAGIFSAERMCIGSAEAANAFLKTLEEPPAQTILFLTTNHPELLLPTIRSRCLALTLKGEKEEVLSSEMEQLKKNWMDIKGQAADVAYRRATLLSNYWRDCREKLEEEFKSTLKEADEESEAMIVAQVESHFILERDQTLRHLILESWKRSQEGKMTFTEAENICKSFEESRIALNNNMDQGLAIERCCLKIGGLL